ncbi:MAG: DegT/DnrJ/EryC1/StrS family aminotransferase [Clostridia bacterium]|nr:DegT/DnrJ/EryC1/StrS family aminotransferase [Clostridia bacterium]
MNKMELFCDKIKNMLGASECLSFSGKVEAVTALFEAIELGERDCVYLSALVPSYIVRAVLICGAVPVFCDVTADGFVIDHKSLGEAVRSTVNVDKLYPRAVVAGNMCGLPFPVRAVKDICDRMGLILIEDCGCGFGGSWDGAPSGSFGDYSLISLGNSSLFGTGGSGCLVTANGANELTALIETCDGSAWDTADGIYADRLLASAEELSGRLAANESALAEITSIMKESDFWLSRGGGRQKSSCCGTIVIAQSEAHCQAAVDCFEKKGLSDFVRKLHVHRRACFEHGCRGFKTLENASALAPRAFEVDIAGAVNAGKFDALTAQMTYIAKNIHE